MRNGKLFFNYVKTGLRMTNYSKIFMHSFLLLKYIVHKNFSFKLGISRRIRYLCDQSKSRFGSSRAMDLSGQSFGEMGATG